MTLNQLMSFMTLMRQRLTPSPDFCSNSCKAPRSGEKITTDFTWDYRAIFRREHRLRKYKTYTVRLNWKNAPHIVNLVRLCVTAPVRLPPCNFIPRAQNFSLLCRLHVDHDGLWHCEGEIEIMTELLRTMCHYQSIHKKDQLTVNVSVMLRSTCSHSVAGR